MKRGSNRGGEGREKERKSFVAFPMAIPCSLKHSELSENPRCSQPGPPAGKLVSDGDSSDGGGREPRAELPRPLMQQTLCLTALPLVTATTSKLHY